MQNVAVAADRSSRSSLRRIPGGIVDSAETMDGKLTRDEIFVDLTRRVAALTAMGHTPGLGTVLVGDDPGSHAYVRGKHPTAPRSASPPAPRPARRRQRRPAQRHHRRTQRQPGLHRLHRPASAAAPPLTRTPRWNASTRARTPTACIPPTSAGWCWGAGAAAVHTARHRGAARRYDVVLDGAHVVVIGRGVTVGARWVCCSPGAPRTPQSRCATPGLATCRRSPGRPTSSSAAVGVPHMLTADMVRPGTAVVDVGVSRVDGSSPATSRPTWGGGRQVSLNPGGVGP